MDPRLDEKSAAVKPLWKMFHEKGTSRNNYAAPMKAPDLLLKNIHDDSLRGH